MKKNYSDFCLIRTFRNIPFWIGIFLITFLSIGSVGAQDLYFYSGGGKIPLKEDRTSTIIQFNENANVQRTMAGMRSSQSLKEIKVHPNRKRAILKFDASQNVTSRQLKTNYFSNTGEIESSAFAFQVEGGMQLWPTDKVLLKLKPGKSLSDLQQLMKQYRATYLKTDHEMVILKVADMQNTLTLSNLIYESGLVAWAHPDFYAEIVHSDNKDLDKKANFSSDNPLFGIQGNPLFRETFVADTYFSDQFQMNNTGQTIDGFPGLNDADCNALEAWNITKGSSDIIVAVIDDGVEEHEDLGNVLAGYTPARPNENGIPKNNDAHGQACAGIIAALHNNIGVAGVAPNVKILPINIFTGEESSADLANVFYWAADNGAHIISNSWGFPSCVFSISAINDAIQYAVTQGRGGKGSIVVFASGNDYQTCVPYPGSNPNVIAVGAFANTGVISAYSNQGTALDIVAPSNDVSRSGNLVGAGVRTIDRMGAAGYDAGNYTNSFGGTSAACPVVSGVAALILSVNPDLTDAEVKDILYTSALDMGTPGRDNTFGHGRVNAYGAVLLAYGDPVFDSCPTGITVSNDPGDCSASVSWTAPTASDNSGSVDFISNFEPGAIFPVGTTEVTYTATNAAGKQATCSFLVTVEDTEDPIISCPANVSETVVFGETGKVITYATPTFSDNCTGVDIERTAGLASGATFPVGETTVTYVATDAAGNTAECSFTVTITEDPDAVDPEISDCPSDITVSNDAGDCSAAVSWTAPTATDNSGSVDLISNFESGAVFPVGTTEVTYTATDAAGNQATCSFTVTVEDTEDPIISCPANVSETVAFGETGKVITYATPTFSDNCIGAGIELKSGPASGATFPVGETTVTYLATDAAGNTSECSFTVTITEDADAVDPEINNCPTDITVSNDPGDCSAAVSWAAPTATDNSGSVNFISNFEPGAVFLVGTTEVTYTATDAAGNQVTCSFDVTVADDELPVIGSVSDISVTVPSGQTVTSLSVPEPSVSDNCSATVTGVRSDGKPLTDPYPVGQTTITWSAEDPSGNDAVEVTQKVTVTQSAPSLAITGFTLINAGTDVDILTLTDGLQISQNQVQGLSLNIRANTNPSAVGSVYMTLSGPVNRTITENAAPYALFGDTNGNYSGRALPAGTYTLTARAYSASNSGGNAGIISSVQFSIVVPVTGITVSPSAATIDLGSAVQLTATVLPSNATNKAVTWSSSNPSFASVNANGLVTGHATGQASITATTVSGGLTASATITVQAVPNLGIASFTLINAGTDLDILTITTGLQISQNQIQGLSLNIRANTNPSVVGSVYLKLSGPVNRTTTENGAPYALFGDTNGNYSGRTLPAGTYTLTARAYSLSGRKGTAGTEKTITFSIVSNAFRIANEEGNVENEVTEKERPTMEVMSEPTLKAFPNPVKDGRVSIVDSRFQEGMVKYVLYSINGAKLSEGQAEIGAGKTISLDFSGPVKQAGMYILILDYNNYLAPQRLQLIFE